MVGIFPEGPFSQHGRLVRGQPGVALVALRAGVPVVPAAIEGTYEALRGRRFYVPRRRPARGPASARRSTSAARAVRPIARAERDEVTRRIMAEIAALLRVPPRPRRGRRPRGRLVTAGGTPPGKAWSGRFTEGADPTAEAFTALAVLRPPALALRSRRAARRGRARSARAELITEAELDGSCSRAWTASARELEGGTFPFRRELEDIHMNVERRLRRAGRRRSAASSTPAARATTRSRSTSGSTSAKSSTRVDAGLAASRSAALVGAGRASTRDAPMPGYTHLQRAQPVLLAHHLLAYVFMLERDRERFARRARARRRDAARRRRARGHRLPDRPRGARARPRLRAARAPNSMDAVADRDFVLEFLAARRHRSACTCRGSPRISPCGPPRSSASWSSPTPSPPARRSCRRRRTPTWPS